MKHPILAMLAILLALAIGAVGAIFVIHTYNTNSAETAEVESVEEEELDSSFFTNSTDAVTYQQYMMMQNFYDSTFVNMPNSVVEEVAYVLIKKNNVTTKEEIVEEYLSNQFTYDALYKRRCEEAEKITKDTNNTTSEHTKQVTNLPRDSASSSSDFNKSPSTETTK